MSHEPRNVGIGRPWDALGVCLDTDMQTSSRSRPTCPTDRRVRPTDVSDRPTDEGPARFDSNRIGGDGDTIDRSRRSRRATDDRRRRDRRDIDIDIDIVNHVSRADEDV
jgi:hypothetical protein